MIYLKSFRLLSEADEEDFFYSRDPLATANYYNSYYPFGVFRGRGLPALELADVTVLYGGNGSGKSTVLNVIAEKLGLRRGAEYNRSDYFPEYVRRCRAETAYGRSVPQASRMMTSDDVFNWLLDIRHVNDGIDRRRAELLDEYQATRGRESRRLASLEEYEQWRRENEARRLSRGKYLRDKLMPNVRERSNGESALAFFAEQIREDALYLLDEPENSLSAARQLELKRFLEDSARFFRCQLIISTHSPFLLAMRGARVYDLDAEPPCVRRWSELENVRAYHDFFKETEDEFE